MSIKYGGDLVDKIEQERQAFEAWCAEKEINVPVLDVMNPFLWTVWQAAINSRPAVQADALKIATDALQQLWDVLMHEPGNAYKIAKQALSQIQQQEAK